MLIFVIQNQTFAMSLITYGKKGQTQGILKPSKSLSGLTLKSVLQGDESKTAERPRSAGAAPSKAAPTQDHSILLEVASSAPRTPQKKRVTLPPSDDSQVEQISDSEEDKWGFPIHSDESSGDDGSRRPPADRHQPAPASKPATRASGSLPAAKPLGPTVTKAARAPASVPAVSKVASVQPPTARTSTKTAPVVTLRAQNDALMLGPGFICPTYISDDFGHDAAFVNTCWDPHGWDKSCGRGKAYPTSSARQSTSNESIMKLVRLQRTNALLLKRKSVPYEVRFSPDGMDKLNCKFTKGQMTRMWDQEYDINSIRQIYLALLPDALSDKLSGEDPTRMNKFALIDALVRNHVPFILFNWMQMLAEELQEGKYVQHTSCEEARRRYLEFWVYCSDDDFAEKEAKALGVVVTPAPQPVPAPRKPDIVPPVDDPRTSKPSQAGNESSAEDSTEPGLPVKDKTLVVVKRKGRRRYVSASPSSTSPSSSSSRSPSRSRSPPPSRSRSPKKRSHSAKLSRSLSPEARGHKAGRSRASKDGGRSRSSKRRARSESPSPARRRKRSHRSSSSSSSGSSRSRSRGRRSHGVQASLARALKGFVKAAKKKPKQPKSRIQKHLDRLDEGLRSGSYIDPCAYSSAHLISIETKGSAAKDCLTLCDGKLFTDENAAEDVTNAPSSMSALKEGLHFIAQRLMSEPEFQGDAERVADRYKFIRYIEADFAAAQSSEKIPVIKEFLRRVAAKRLWCPEIPNESALFFRAFAVPATKNVHVDDNGEQIPKRRNRNRADKAARGARGRGANANGNRGRGGGGGRGGGNGGVAMMPNLHSDADRKRNGTCPSRMTAVGACPSIGKPWECKFDHSCPRCQGKSHIAKNCKLLT